MATTQVSIRLNIEGKAEVKRAFDEVGRAGQDSFRNVGAAMDSAGAATDRETQRLQRLAQAARQAQAAEAAQRNFNAVLGIDRPAAGAARESARVFEDAAKAAEDLEVRAAALRAQIDPLGEAQRRMNAEIAEADTLFKAGAITQKEHGEAVALAKDRFDLAAGALGSLGEKSGLTGGQIRALISTFRLAASAAAAGEVPLAGLTIQALKLGKAFGADAGGLTGIAGGVGRALASVITPATAVTGTLLAVGGAAVLAYDSWLRGQKQLEIAAAGLGRTVGATSDQLDRIARSTAAAAGVSVAVAREMELAFLKTGRIGSEHFEGLIKVAKNYATTVGTDVASATKELADAFADPVKGADDLNQKLKFLDDRTRQYIRRLVEQNDRTAAQRALLEAMRGSLANAESATTALGRAWDAVKRAASDAAEAIGRAVDRAAGGGTPEEQLARLERQMAALSRGGGAPTRVLAELKRQADDLRARIAEARRQADLGRVEAEARELSLKVGEAVRDIVPGTEVIGRLEAVRSSLGRLLEDPLAARHVGNLSGVEDAYRRVTQALASYAGENTRFVDPQERKLRLQQIEIELINAATPARRAALEAERARIELVGQAVTPEQAALTMEQARSRVLAETSRFLRDYARDQQFAIEQTQAEIAFVGRSVEAKDVFIARLRAEQDLRRQGVSATSAEGQIILANAERQAALNAALDRARELMQGWQSVFDSTMNRVADLLAQGKLDWKSWADAARTAIADINREIIKLALINPLKNLLFGTNAPTLSASGGLLGSLLGAFRFHAGGVVGMGGTPALAPAAVFRHAPRFHDGVFLKPDEVPAILQRGERVLSRAETSGYERGGAARVQVNVINQAAGTEVRTRRRREGGVDIRDVIIATVGDGMANGRLDAPLRSRFGLSVPGRPR